MPSALSAPQVGQLLDGIVSARLAATQLVVETNAGNLVLRSSFPLPLNTPVTLQFTTAGQPPTVLILPQARSAVPVPATVAPSSAQAGPDFVGTIVNATVTVTGGPQRSAAGGPPVSGLQSAAPGITLTQGSQLSVRILGLTPPGAAPASGTQATIGQVAAPPATAGPAVNATVIGADRTGQTQIRIGNAELMLATNRPIPVGSNLLLEPLPLFSSSGAPDLQSLALAQRWETLHEALRLSAGLAHQPALSGSIPQPNLQLAGALLFFVAALRSGDLRGWLGQDASRGLERAGLLERMADDFGVMQRLATDPAGQDWRLFLIPLLSDDQLHQMRLFVRDDPGQSEESAPPGVRFIIEVTFSRLGPFQFDGLVRDKSMDLIIRTEKPLPGDAHNAIGQIYGDTLAALGFAGSVAIRTERFFEVQPLYEADLPRKPGVIA